MNKKILIILLVVIITLFSNGCSNKINLVETIGEHFTTYTDENISIKIFNKVKDNENIYNTILENLQKINGFSPIDKIEIDIDEKYVIPIVEDSIKCNSDLAETEEFKKELIKKSYGIYDNWISEGLYAKIYNIEKLEVDNIKSASINLVEYLIKRGKKEELLKNQIYI
ncbi:hypothetical protein [uncultured Tissierella sp.]|uniref:hypothetical protein n=1 Tax=uncultured Tissierella sp. TaxID=448160 RepID=UPI002805038B|nr:hypothetical protein [uncultured Tissierella sp.]MDU5082781.1 hypothetical protein [Bacillota bacterium]